jgi:acyl-coenzyme A synthetase/AMP-(fatty) acid ligase
MNNIASMVYEQALLRPSSIAIITNQHQMTYLQVSRLVSILARHFRLRGVAPEEVVGVSMAQNPLHLLTILALAQVGAISLPLHQAIPVERRLLAARRFGAHSVVSGLNEFALEGLSFIGLDSVNFESGSPGDEFIQPVTKDAPMRIAISSGTSGDPKGMILTHGIVALRNQTVEAGATSLSRVIPMDINFIVGFRPAISTLARGGALIFPPTLAPEDVMQSMIQHRVTHVYFSPYQARDIADRIKTSSVVCPDLACLRIGGGHISKDLLHTVTKKLSGNVYASYGSTESGMVTYATPEMLADHPDTVGKVCRWAKIEVVDAEDNLLLSGTKGLIRIRSEHQVKGYYLDEERSNRFFHDEWFYPGDIGHFDTEGLLYIDGRMDEQINLGGMMIYPEDIENTLILHPAVDDAGFFVMMERDNYEVPAVALVLNDLTQMKEVQLYAHSKLGPLAPIRYVSVLTLPRTVTGKLIRRELTTLCTNN